MNKTLLQAIRPLLVIFVVLTGFFIIGKDWFFRQGIDNEVLIVGNLVMFVATIASLLILFRGGRSTNPQQFVRSMYGSFMIRFFLILVAAFIYIMSAKKNVNKPALVICAVLYFVYSFIEISILLRVMKKKQHG
jgi:ATP synthase I chain.